MRVTCPRCGGAEQLNDLSLVQSDLYYSRGHLRSTPTYPFGGFPALSCDVCKGQGWVDSEAFISPAPTISGLFYLHQTSDGFWVLPDEPHEIFEGHFTDDPSGSGFVIIRTDLDQGWFPSSPSGFVALT